MINTLHNTSIAYTHRNHENHTIPSAIMEAYENNPLQVVYQLKLHPLAWQSQTYCYILSLWYINFIILWYVRHKCFSFMYQLTSIRILNSLSIQATSNTKIMRIYMLHIYKGTIKMDWHIPERLAVVTNAGPRGQKVSNVFPSSHCFPFFCNCQSLALTSCAIVYPATYDIASDV